MARYTKLFNAAEPIQSLQKSMVEMLEDCDLNLVYETADYIFAREKPGEVPFSQLVTVEVLINPPRSDVSCPQINLVVKNEALILKDNSHCETVFNEVKAAITETQLGCTA